MKHLLFPLGLMVLAGCESTTRPAPLPNDPYYAPVIPEPTQQSVSGDGAIFQFDRVNSLYSDVKARRVGDIITVTLVESTSAQKSAGTSTSKENEIEINPVTGLGGDIINLSGQSIQLGAESTTEFTGDAQANQSNTLTGSITVTVVRVLPNQNLMVRGEKWLTLNNGDEYIRLTGIVRPADITPDNEVVSTRVANARIQYSGTGDFATTQKQGWLSRFFNKWWPI